MRKKLNSFLLIIGLAVIISFSGCEDDSSGTSIVCLGDDFTAGRGEFNMVLNRYSYPVYLGERVNIPVINAGVDKDTSTQALSRLNQDVLSKDPRIVVIMLGLNDITSQIPTDITEANLREIISKIDDGKRKIYLVKFYTDEIGFAIGKALTGGALSDDTIKALIALNNAMFESLSSIKNVTLIEDIWDGVWGVPDNMANIMYPNRDGYKKIADNIFKGMEPYLKANGLIRK